MSRRRVYSTRGRVYGGTGRGAVQGGCSVSVSALRVGICPEARPIKDRYGGGGGWLSAETLADIEAIVVMFEPVCVVFSFL